MPEGHYVCLACEKTLVDEALKEEAPVRPPSSSPFGVILEVLRARQAVRNEIRSAGLQLLIERPRWVQCAVLSVLVALSVGIYLFARALNPHGPGHQPTGIARDAVDTVHNLSGAWGKLKDAIGK